MGTHLRATDVRPQLTQPSLQMSQLLLEQYCDAEMVLGMEGNTNTSSQEETVKIWYLHKSQRTCWASNKEIWQAELGKLKKSV